MLTSRLPDNYRQACRFVVVGSTGTLLQYGLYWAFLKLNDSLWPDIPLATVAYTLAFIIETITNYLLTTWYTFSQKVSWRNLGGFAASRVSNYLVQIILLHGFLWASISEELAGALTMVLAGVINFFVVRFFFKK